MCTQTSILGGIDIETCVIRAILAVHFLHIIAMCSALHRWLCWVTLGSAYNSMNRSIICQCVTTWTIFTHITTNWTVLEIGRCIWMGCNTSILLFGVKLKYRWSWVARFMDVIITMRGRIHKILHFLFLLVNWHLFLCAFKSAYS